jgi:hypothetical protein
MAFVNAEIDAIDGLEWALFGDVIRLQVGNLQFRRAMTRHSRQTLSLGNYKRILVLTAVI